MKVLFIFREPRASGYSIEGIFNGVISELKDLIEIETFYVDPARSRWQNIRAVSKVKADIYHVTGDCNYMTYLLPKDKTILTVHDVGHYEKTLTGIKKAIYGLIWWRIPLAITKNITAISEFTADKLVKFFQVDRRKVTVIYDPVGSIFEYAPANSICKTPKILQVGSSINKNLERLIEAVKGLDVQLLLLNKLSNDWKEKLAENKINYIQYQGLSDEKVLALYKETDIVFFASTYEGFGLPIIEAQTVGRPVITSNISSMPEVAGDGAILVNPYSVEEIREAIKSLIDSEIDRRELVKQGKENVKKFNLKKIAMDYFELYKKIAKK